MTHYISSFTEGQLLCGVICTLAYGIGAGVTMALVADEGFRKKHSPLELFGFYFVITMLWLVAFVVFFGLWLGSTPKQGR